MSADAKAKAAKAAKAVKKGSFKNTRKPRYSVIFHRPKTLNRTRLPKYTRSRYKTMIMRSLQFCGDWLLHARCC